MPSCEVNVSRLVEKSDELSPSHPGPARESSVYGRSRACLSPLVVKRDIGDCALSRSGKIQLKMALEAGTRLGHYEVLSSLGAGGMGEVYRAKDTKLGREVAIKLLLAEVSADPERLARFDREARVLASLNHNNIATLYGFEKEGDTSFLVMELVEGETLAERISRGAIPVDEALPLFLQIAEGLEAAHEKGIIHRDLKPANIKTPTDGSSTGHAHSSSQVKILDFGLAKAMDVEEGPTDCISASLSPTLTLAATQRGEILGTAAYMSPEQAKGEPADHRADIWAFGVCLMEALTGHKTFQGDSAPETLARVLERDPDLDTLPGTVGPGLHRILGRCMRKAPGERFQHMIDVRLALEDAEIEPPSALAESKRRTWISVAVGGLVLGVLATVIVMPRGGSPSGTSAEPTRFIVRTQGGEPLEAGPIALSPDGRSLVMAVGEGSGRRLVRRELDDFELQVLAVGAAINMPFFSPDSEAVGYTSAAGIERIELASGASRSVISIGDAVGAAWLEDGGLVLSRDWGEPLSLLRSGAQTAEKLTEIRVDEEEGGHLWPQALPGGTSVLFTVWRTRPTWDESAIAIADLATGKHRIVLEGGAFGRYAESGHLLFWRNDGLMAVPFDPQRSEVVGTTPVRVVDGVRLDLGNGSAGFAISHNGTLAYVEGGAEAFEVTELVDLESRETVERIEVGVAVGQVEFSPDGSQLALTIRGGGMFDIGIWERDREVLSQLTFDYDNYSTTWNPSGDRVAFRSNRGGGYEIWSIAADGSSEPELLVGGESVVPGGRTAWSPDGRHLLFVDLSSGTSDVRALDLDNGEITTVVATSAAEWEPDFSPDGNFVLYSSSETGRYEIFAVPFPEGGRKWPVSAAGGRSPKWDPSGDRIFYIGDAGVMVVSVTISGSSLALGRPSLFLEIPAIQDIAISSDGTTMAIGRRPLETMASEVRVVLNWFEELERLVPTD